MDLHIDKKPRLECNPISEYEDEDEDLLQDIKADIDLEIGLRQRLLTTVEARIEWAQTLCQALDDDNLPDDLVGTVDFKAAAVEAFSAMEAPIEILFARDIPPPPLQTRPITRKKPTLRTQLTKKSVKFLYTYLDGNPTPSILRCPLCLRTDFGSLQGLFNHARGTHSLAWTSHEECVRHCACAQEELLEGPVDFTNLDLGGEVGFGTGGMGLRGLFEQAVGGDASLDFEGETTLSRTLGLHSQTPALASFLGKQPIRRGVMVWDPDAVVDIDGFSEEKASSSPKRRWRMPFSHRNVFKDVPVATEPPSPSPETPTENTTAAAAATAPPNTRFHVTTRVVVADRSLWLPPETRTGSDTHKWMISVDAPSYARHITTVLERLAVNGPTGRLTTIAPPFAVIGTASEPFLARIELHIGKTENGTPQQIMLEHWVELDRMQSRSVAFGEEQMVDLDLHRTTVFLPQRSGYIPTYSRALWEMEMDKERRTSLELASGMPTTDPNPVKDLRNRTRNAVPRIKMLGSWENVLRTLVERFPLTLQDVKGGRPPVPALPYRLVSSLKKFSNLILGRRKAIEWGRAAAMCSAYNEALNTGLTEDITALTTADVFSWLHTHGYFPHDAAVTKQEQTIEEYKTGFCPVCGLSYRVHAAAYEASHQSIPAFGDGFECKIITPEWRVRRLPMVDVRRILMRRPATTPSLTTTDPPPIPTPEESKPPHVRPNNANWDSRAAVVLSVVEPLMVAAVRKQVEGLGLRTFASAAIPIPGIPDYPIHPSLPSASQIRTDLAPHAMLALVTKPLIRALINTALAVSVQDGMLARQMAQVDQQRARRNPGLVQLFSAKRMLMPSHILRGIIGRSWDWTDQLGMAVMGIVSKSGVPLEHAVPPPAAVTDLVLKTELQRQSLTTATSTYSVMTPSGTVKSYYPRGVTGTKPSIKKEQPPPLPMPLPLPAPGTGWIPADSTWRPQPQPKPKMESSSSTLVGRLPGDQSSRVQFKTEQD
ncbi:hypothetical protein C8F01DRAFT_440709 [Mycena amicta]|nr:hypothetical protein C8F01DRAFT_440709 [Mycena amicta]